MYTGVSELSRRGENCIGGEGLWQGDMIRVEKMSPEVWAAEM